MCVDDHNDNEFKSKLAIRQINSNLFLIKPKLLTSIELQVVELSSGLLKSPPIPLRGSVFISGSIS